MNQSKNLLSEIDFTNLFNKNLILKVKDIDILEINQLEIKTRDTEGEIYTHFLNNAFAEYNYEPSDLDEIIERYSTASSNLYSQKTPIDTNCIIPIIKDKRFFDECSNLSEEFSRSHVYEMYNSDLYIFYAEDKEDSISYLTTEDLEELSLNIKDLQNLAVNNLESLLEIERSGDSGIFMLLAGGNYESSLILFDIWNEDNFPVNGEIILAIPSRDLVFITGSNELENIEKLKNIIIEINKEGDHIVSDKLFILKDSHFQVLN
ncbi:hypothetical protein ASG31_07450 [Chryseobacterium sp. Leaf404]|uniref:DUF1444 family protein n=1 Tax=unclassified Chryseobacterium TaxID=2593645 RepID=UPI0006F44B2E|nr:MULTISPECIES: DUF1444 family protein [unclassified Chryseobacterium]KQT18543.1 hypothetical protein ASG31_07450 [Chryseobacterium sp. Leaf404]